MEEEEEDIFSRQSFDTFNSTSFEEYTESVYELASLYKPFYKTIKKHNPFYLEVLEQYYDGTMMSKQTNYYSLYFETLKEMFHMVPPLPHDMLTYRCYTDDVSLKDIDGKPIQRFISTSLSHKMSREWCSNKHNVLEENETGNVIICIIVPRGAKALPLYNVENDFGEIVITERQRELLLPPSGKLVNTGKVHQKYGMPMFKLILDDITTKTAGRRKSKHTLKFRREKSKKKKQLKRNKKSIKQKKNL